MMRGIKALAVLAAVAALAVPQAFALCDSSIESYAIFQCADRAYFAPLPAGAGTISGVFWGIGFGNGTINDGTDYRGFGMTGKSTFNGNDNGIWTMDIIDTDTRFPGFGFPSGAKCLGSNNWANRGVDGCCDNPRDATQSFTDDNVLNPLYDVAASRGGYPGVASTAWVQDAPMGVLLKESTGTWFAVAAVSSNKRSGPTDVIQGYYGLRDVTNGDVNVFTGEHNVITWQRVPGDKDPANPLSGLVRTVTIDTGTNDRIVDLGWTGAVVQNDGRSSPSTNPVVNALGLTGIGIPDLGSLVRYVVEQQAIVDPNDPIGSLSPTGWSATTLGSGPTDNGSGGFTAQATVAPDTCMRLHTYFGLEPQTTTYSATTCRQGICGDVGYDLTSAPSCIGGALAADGVPQNAKAVRAKGDVDVTFSTSTELSVRDYHIFALTSNAGRLDVATLACTECTTGSGASYTARIPMGQLKGARELEIVASTGATAKVSIK